MTTTPSSTNLDRPASLDRRGFLKTTGLVGGSLVIGLGAFVGAGAGAAGTDRARRPINAFISIGQDGRVTLTMPKVEMGQGTYTSIPMLLAEELEVDMKSIDLMHAPPDAKTYGLPYGDQFTGASTSIQWMWMPMRQAGAAAREMLIQAAATRWKVSPQSCRAESGEVVHSPSGRRLRYGELVEQASKLPVPDSKSLELKPASQFKLIGKSQKRLDSKAKTDGSALYGIDVILPGMKFATVAACPTIGGTVESVDDSKALKMTGVRAVLRIDNAVAVVADNMWYAKEALAALDIKWLPGPNANLSTEDIKNVMLGALRRKGAIARNDGNAAAVIASDPNRYEVIHINPMIAHATMETMNCTVDIREDSATIWTGTQIPARARDSAAKLLGLPPEKVVLNGFLLGGGFGRRLGLDYIDQAVLFGKAWKGKGPVKFVWTREEDIQHDLFRGMYAHSVAASVGADGNPLALHHKIAGPSNLAAFSPSLIHDGIDDDAVEGSVQLCYDIPNVRTEWIREDGPIPTMFWRGVGPTRNTVVLESFIDELAIKAGKDPLAYRLALLTKNKRAHHVLKRAGELANWGSAMPARSGRGISLMHSWDTYIGQVVDLAVAPDGTVSVKRVVCVIDCGVIVNPDTVVAQMEGGIVFGLSAALYGEITFTKGRVEQSNFHDAPAMRFDESPKIDVEMVRSDERPGGVGEPGTAGIKAAFANAVFAATGKRIHSLPAKPEMLKA